MLFKASAPGSLMLLGEYAVLYGYPALVCAIDKRIIVTLEPREDKYIHLKSNLGTLHMPLMEISVEKPFEFVLMTLKKYQSYFTKGCNIIIEAEFSNTVGFASSAAVTVAALSVISAWLGFSYSNHDLLKIAREIVFEVQGMGSGADVAACIYGGIIAYESKTLSIKKFLSTYPITVIYSGSKTRTSDAVNQVKKTFADKPKEFLSIIQKIGEYTKKGIQWMAEKNWTELGLVMNGQQVQMKALGVNTYALDCIMTELLRDTSALNINEIDSDSTLNIQKNGDVMDPKKYRYRRVKDTGILGVKISGSGLGDCIVGLGNPHHTLSFSVKGAALIPVNITTQGVYCEKG